MKLPTSKSLALNLNTANRREIVGYFYNYRARKYQQEIATPHPLDYKSIEDSHTYYTTPQLLFSMREYIDMCFRERRTCIFQAYVQYLNKTTIYTAAYCLCKMLLIQAPAKYQERLKSHMSFLEQSETAWFHHGTGQQRQDIINDLKEIKEELYS